MLVRTKLAHLPYRKTLEDFNFQFQPSIDERQVQELATMAFVNRAENLVLLGPPGVGKTHLAIAFTIRGHISRTVGLFCYGKSVDRGFKKS